MSASLFSRLMLFILFLLTCLSTAVVAVDDSQTSDAFMRSHSFVFISGWPQSGTSLLQQILHLHPMVSTMVDQCQRLVGKRCENFNHEGQWLLPSHLHPVVNAGNLCPHPGNLSTALRQSVLAEWRQYWLDRPLLVEKSPQSLVKLPMLRELFTNASVSTL
ncbi:hypothetical protein B484DRAFT_400409 [Ochromonadaceae sp. CCMP2298]|nr:hypothetical protein B484DRAFT_400409 [Ochromonadaceae sp. CCMP2298]